MVSWFIRFLVCFGFVLSSALVSLGDDDDAPPASSLGDQLFCLIKDYRRISDGAGYIAAVQRLINKGVNVRATDDRGLSALHWAITRWSDCDEGRAARVEVVRLLLEAGADVDAGSGEATPLHWSTCKESTSVLQLLLDWNADVTLCDRFGGTPLHAWVRNGGVQGVQLLLDHRAEVDARNARGETPLFVAARRADSSIVKALLRAGARVDAEDDKGRAAFVSAVFWGHFETACVLLESGADGSVFVDTGIDDGTHVLLYLVRKMVINRSLYPDQVESFEGMLKLVRLLLEEALTQGEVNSVSDRSNRRTPLHEAAARGLEEVVRLLIAAKAKLSVQEASRRSWTPLDCALDGKHWSIAQMLLEAGARTYAMMEGTWYTSSYIDDNLRAAAEARQWDVFTLLLEYANPPPWRLEFMLEDDWVARRADQIRQAVAAYFERRLDRCPRVIDLIHEVTGLHEHRGREASCTEVTVAEDSDEATLVEDVEVELDVGALVALDEGAESVELGPHPLGEAADARGGGEIDRGCD